MRNRHVVREDVADLDAASVPARDPRRGDRDLDRPFVQRCGVVGMIEQLELLAPPFERRHRFLRVTWRSWPRTTFSTSSNRQPRWYASPARSDSQLPGTQ